METKLSIKRAEYIKICGNISKHNFTKLSGVTGDIINIFGRNKKELNFEEALQVLDDFYEKFHDNALSYRLSTIAEFLNNIRWGVYEYLQPEYERAMVIDKNVTIKHEYNYPDDINNKFAKECYWELMDEVRSKPYIPRFKVEEILKKHY